MKVSVEEEVNVHRSELRKTRLKFSSWNNLYLA